VSTRVLTD